MENTDHSNAIYIYDICAVVFGTDESILNLSLNDGFSFVRRSLIPDVDHLNDIFDSSAEGLRRFYEMARLCSSSLDVVCIEKHQQITLDISKAYDWYSEQVDRDLDSLDRQIRTIRLYEECALRCRLVSFKMKTIKGKNTSSYSSYIPISESETTREISRFHCEQDKLQILQNKIYHILYPNSNRVLNTAHRFYDLSYHQENYESLVLLIIAAEIIFLAKGEVAKKERLAKRCAVFMFDSQGDRILCYKRMLLAYKQRGDFVHDGKFTDIEDSTILFLREVVRNALISNDPHTFNKTTFVDTLQKRVEETNYWNQNI